MGQGGGYSGGAGAGQEALWAFDPVGRHRRTPLNW